MCTVSFLPNSEGFDLLMNRDELLSRTAALPPSIHRCGPLEALYPSEKEGGTWIGINQAGLALALINWYSKPHRQAAPSRGIVIPALLAAATQEDAERLLAGLPLSTLNPFRLMIFSASRRCLREWRSDGHTLQSEILPWRRMHWFSSGFDEREANRVRWEYCKTARVETLADLHALHSSHEPSKGPFSLCMHREDARTVSSTALSVGPHAAAMTYREGSPCEGWPELADSLPLSA